MNPEDYVRQLFVTEDDLLAEVRQTIVERGMPAIFVPPEVGHFLGMLVTMTRSRDILEIGALGGYSGIWLARALPDDGHLTSLELNPEYAALAHHHLTRAGLGEKVRYEIGPALDSLNTFKRQGQRFDFFFIDADKENYPAYLDYAVALARPGAVIVGDNALFHGRVLDPHHDSDGAVGMREFNQRLATDSRLTSTLLTIGDGLAIGVLNF